MSSEITIPDGIIAFNCARGYIVYVPTKGKNDFDDAAAAFKCTNKRLKLFPNATACIEYLYNIIWMRPGVGIKLIGNEGKIEIKHLSITYNRSENFTKVKWLGEGEPKSFLEFEKEWYRYWDRQFKLKVFW